MTEAVGVAATGMVAPVGLGATRACAALRAMVSRIRIHPTYAARTTLDDLGPETDDLYNRVIGSQQSTALKVAAVPGVDFELAGLDRLVRLMLGALQDLVISAGLDPASLAELPLRVVLPGGDPVADGWAPSRRDLWERLRAAGVGRWSAFDVQVGGTGAALLAVDDLRRRFAEGAMRAAVVLVADSLVDPARLAHLDVQGRLLTERSPRGFIPGEAAVALLLRAEPSRVEIGPVGVGEERHPRHAGRSSSGRGLVGAIEAAAAAWPDRSVGSWVLCTLNGEPYAMQEWGLALPRLTRLAALQTLVHPAQHVGDCGIAMAPLLVALVHHHAVRGAAPSDKALLWAGSDTGTRVATVVSVSSV